METCRSFGNYDFPAAIADIIDNSISAKATKISIDFDYKKNDENSFIRIADNGSGMLENELIDAMTLASKNPRAERNADDMGRFGLGLKTASFSQGRQLTVISKKQNKICAALQDLDKFGDWNTELYEGEEASSLFLRNPFFETSTEVIWRKLHRLTESFQMTKIDFNSLITAASDELSLIFHRYLSKNQFSRNKQLEIFVNGEVLRSLDPFKTDHPATQQLETEEISLPNGKVIVTPFVLPHYSKLSPNEYEKLAGEEGYVKNQGFYIYRNKRLIIHGTWFRLFRHGALSKLARVRVDIPNSLDEEWRISVDKSNAQLPSLLKNRLRDLVERIGTSSSRVYRQRGSKVSQSDLTPFWTRNVKKGQIRFNINSQHPSIKNFSENLNKEQNSGFVELLHFIAGTFPIETVYSDYSEHPNELVQSETEPNDLIIFASKFVKSMLDKGMSQEDLLALLKNTEPFSTDFNVIVETLKQRKIIL